MVRELLIALLVMLVFLFAGEKILAFLSLRAETVSISGGIILFLIAIKMIFPSASGNSSGLPAGEEPFIVPLAIPLVAGPTILATLMLLSHQYPNQMGHLVIALLLAWGGTETYISNTKMASFGYANSKSYGVSISQYTPNMAKVIKRDEPTGWIIGSEFSDMWYGFYCYETSDFVVKDNTYHDNIVYGIDPHDRSHGLIIADNTVHGTKKKHGIIISREVNDSFIFNNRSYDNKLSGLVIDRNSVNNLIAYNEIYRNHTDGITLYESGDNLIWGNKLINNRRHGIRVRNSVNIRLYENLAAGNQLIGVYGHIKDLTNTDRNIALDPFDTKVSLIVVGGKLAGNGSGPLSR